MFKDGLRPRRVKTERPAHEKSPLASCKPAKGHLFSEVVPHRRREAAEVVIGTREYRL
jgi:hypothetical protein